MICPNCNTEFEPKALNQVHCGAKCRADWHNRRMKRGSILYDAVMTKRYGMADGKGRRLPEYGDLPEMNETDLRRLVDELAAAWHAEDNTHNRKRTWNDIRPWLRMNPWVRNFRKTFKV